MQLPLIIERSGDSQSKTGMLKLDDLRTALSMSLFRTVFPGKRMDLKAIRGLRNTATFLWSTGLDAVFSMQSIQLE